MNTKRLYQVVTVIIILIAIVFLYLYYQYDESNNTSKEPVFSNSICDSKLTQNILDESLELGKKFLINNQKVEGNFNYEYNWITQQFNPSDSQVRQAGVLWGLSLIYQDQPNESIFKSIEKSFSFFQNYSVVNSQGARYIKYLGEAIGKTGTVALVCLSHIDFLRSAEHGTKKSLENLSLHLDQYLTFLLDLRMDNGQFYQYYNLTTGEGYGDPSPYFDGEALLALTKAEKYLNKSIPDTLIIESAQQMYKINVEQSLIKDPDSPITKGFFQWGCMAYFELFTSDLKNNEEYGEWVISLANWMIDVHKTTERTRNTAYAHEGIIHAYEISRLNDDRDHLDKFACVIDKELYKLTSWQVGGPLQNEYLKSHPTNDSYAIGGIMNHRKEPFLRIDVAQHQMHAVVLAQKYLYK